jgi:hypothetical protein
MSQLEKDLVRTVIPTGHELKMFFSPKVQLTLLGNGPTADLVSRLGLNKRGGIL